MYIYIRIIIIYRDKLMFNLILTFLTYSRVIIFIVPSVRFSIFLHITHNTSLIILHQSIKYAKKP